MMFSDFKGKTAIVTGGSRGIGKAIAELLLHLNCSVVITGTGSQPSWCREYKECEFRRLDFLDMSTVQDFLKERDGMKPIDILINNAGMQIPQSIYEIDEQRWDDVLKVNLYGPMKMMHAVTPQMKTLKKGKILNISSIAGVVSKPQQSAYSASKSGLIGLTRSVALDLAPYNILINALCPGPTITDMSDDLLTEEQKDKILGAIPLKRFARVEEIANYAVFLCSNLNTYITGQAIVVDGGALAQ